jgi:4-hydroxybenzoyl-CoA thioesterase
MAPQAIYRRLSLASFVFRRQATVEYGHCDPDGVVFVARLFQYFDTSTWLMLEAALGARPPDFMATIGIVPLVDVRVKCLKPVRFGDLMELSSRVAEFRRSSFDVAHAIAVGGEPAVEGGETRVWAVRDKNDPAKISSRPIPGDVIERFGGAPR